MYLKILKKDLKRKKSMALILLVFVVLATMFISSSLNNVVVVTSGTEYFFEQAGLSDYLLLTMRAGYDADDSNEKEIEEFLKEQKSVDSYTMDPCMYLAKTNIGFKDNREFELSSTMIFTSYQIGQQKFYDVNNQEITSMEDGSIYLPNVFMKENEIAIGEKIIVSSDGGYEKEFEVAGSFKDAFLGSELMGTHRYLLSQNDFEELMQESGLPFGYVYSVKTNDLESFEKAYNNEGFHVIFGGTQSLIKTTYIMDMVIAAVLMLVSLCLILISVVMLRFIIIFTVNQDYKEIGIMKSIGMQNASIRKLYVVKYSAIAFVGAVIGFAAGLPFGKMLLVQVTENIITKDDNSGILLQLVASILVAVIITGFAYHSTGKIKKMSPMDAIRSGNNGERFKRKGLLNLSKFKGKATTFMACNDVLCDWKKYMALLLTSIAGIWLLVMPINTINTLQSEKILQSFAILDCDYFISDDKALTELIMQGNKEGFYEYLDKIKTTLKQEDIPVEKTFMEIMFKYRVRKEDKSYLSLAMQGINTTTKEYVYDKGTAPEYENEVALAYTTADAIGADLGDTVYITINEEEKPFVVSAFYQSMNNMGEGIRFHEETVLDYQAVTGAFGAQVLLREKTSQEQKIIEKTKELYPQSDVRNKQEFLDSMLGGISERLSSLKILILVLVVIIDVMVVVLMQKMFLIRERGEMGMMKAIGFSDGAIIVWQTKRILLVLLVGILLGVVTGTPFSKLTSGQVFKIMGARNIEFVVNPLEVYAVYPVTVLVITVIACVITMRKVKRISVQETNNIE